MENCNHQDKVVSQKKFSTKNINTYVQLYIKNKLGGFELDERNNEFKYLLKDKFEDLDGSYRAFFTEGVDHNLAFDYHFDKSKQPEPEECEADSRKDVFDELTPIFLAEENCRAKILFPYSKSDNHWLVGELVLDKSGNNVSVVVLAHDSCGSGQLSDMKVDVLEKCLKKAFVNFDVKVSSKISQYALRRLSLGDVISSGVIVADELVKRITNESLVLTSTYPVGARQLRDSQIMFLIEFQNDELQTVIENLALKDGDFEYGNHLVLSFKEVRKKLQDIVKSEDPKEKIEKFEAIEKEYYKPLIKQLAHKNSFEELKNLVFVFDDLIILSLNMSDLKNELEYLAEAAVYCQYMKTILKERFPAEKSNPFLDQYSMKQSQRWNEIQEKLVTEVGGNLEVLPNMSQEIQEYREHVIKIRKEAKIAFELIEKRFERLKKSNPQDIEQHRNNKIGPVQDLFKNIAQQMRAFLARVYNDSERDMSDPKPCPYAIIGLGSLALQQITLHSDFEFAILTELDAHNNPEIMDYFKNLTHLVRFKIIGLGETSIPNSKFGVDLKHFVHVGINFDLGGKTPLGRADKPYSLIKTVPEMLNYVYNKDDTKTHIDKCLPYIVENVCYVSGDEKLVEEYQKKVTEFFNQTNENNEKNCEVRALKVLEEGAVEFDYVSKTPNLDPKQTKIDGDLKKLIPNLTGNHGKYFNVKQEIYRLSDRMVYNMGLFFGIEGNSCWDTIHQLKKAGVINEMACKSLLYTVTFANLLRLKTYFKNKAQTGVLSIYPTKLDSTESTMLELAEEDLEENGELFNYYYRAIPLYSRLKEFCANYQTLKQSDKPHFFQAESFFQNDSLMKGSIYIRLNQWTNAIRHLLPATATKENNLYVSTMITDAYFNIGKYDLALKHYQECVKIKIATFDDQSEFLSIELNNLGLFCRYKGDYKQALQYHRESLDKNESDSNEIAATSYNCIGHAYDLTGHFDLALENYKECLKIRRNIHKDNPNADVALTLNNIGAVYYAKSESDLAIQYYNESLDIKRIIFKDGPHPEVAISLCNIGAAFYLKKDWDQALLYFNKSLVINQSVYKDNDVDHPTTAFLQSNIGMVYHYQGNNDVALQYLTKSLEIRRTIFGNLPHPDVATSLDNIGVVHSSKADSDLALQFHNESLKIRRNVFKDNAHPDVAVSLNNISRIYLSKGELGLALECLEESLKIRETVYNDNFHPAVVTLKSNIEFIYAIKKSRDDNAIHKDVTHTDVGTSSNNIESTYDDEVESALKKMEI